MKILLQLIRIGTYSEDGSVSNQVWGDEIQARWFAKALRKKGFDVDIKQIGTTSGDYDIVIDFHPQAMNSVVRTKKRFFWHQGDMWGHSIDRLQMYDIVFTASQVALAGWKNQFNVVELLPGVDLEERSPVDVKKEYDIIFIGNKLVRGDNDYIRFLLPIVDKEFKIKIYGNGWENDKRYSKYWGGLLNMNEICTELSKAKIRLCINSQYHRDWDMIVGRDLETLACGVDVLVDKIPIMDKLFGGSSPVIFTTGFDDIVEKVDMVSKHYFDRGGVIETIKNHTWDKRVESILDVLKVN